MSLEFLLNVICDLAIKRNLVNYSCAGPSIYALNNETIKDYPFIFISPTDNITTRKNFTDYILTFFYVERLLDDMSNETHIFSIANDTIVNLCRQLRQLEGIVSVSEPNVRLFTETERMADRCAGGYSNITITVQNDAECPVWMDEEGEFMGTYIPQTLKDLSVLDSLASKTWVAQYVEGVVISGGTDEKEVKRLINQALKDYTKTSNFATINGSGITSGQSYNLVERSEFRTFYSAYTQEVEDIYRAISAATPEDYEENVAKIAKNADDIVLLSGQTSANTVDIATLSASTQGIEGTVHANTDSIEALSAYTSDAISSLSGATTALSAATSDAISAISASISAATSGMATEQYVDNAVSGLASETYVDNALSGKQDALTAGDNITIQNNVISAAGNVSSTTVLTIWSGPQAAYDAITTKDANTLYVITDVSA